MPPARMSFSRREFVTTSASLLAGTSLLGMADAGASATEADQRRRQLRVRLPLSAEQLIVVWCRGGLSHLDAWDPKPAGPGVLFRPVSTTVPGLEVSELFPQLARQFHHCLPLRSVTGVSLTGKSDDHQRAVAHLEVGENWENAAATPDLMTRVAQCGPFVAGVPRLVSINPAVDAITPGLRGPVGVGQIVRPDPALSGSQDRATRDCAVSDSGTLFRSGWSSPNSGLTAGSLSGAGGLIDEYRPEVYAALSSSQFSTPAIDRYGDSPVGRSCLMASRLNAAGVRSIQINQTGFDLHSRIEQRMSQRAAELDPALASLIEDLDAAGRLERTLVVVLTEFGRAPRMNPQGGRDHWASVFSVLLAGGGTGRATQFGASDRDGAQPAEHPVLVSDLAWLIEQACRGTSAATAIS